MVTILHLMPITVIFWFVWVNLCLINYVIQRFDNLHYFFILTHQSLTSSSLVHPSMHTIAVLYQHLFLRICPKRQIATGKLTPGVHFLLQVQILGMIPAVFIGCLCLMHPGRLVLIMLLVLVALKHLNIIIRRQNWGRNALVTSNRRVELGGLLLCNILGGTFLNQFGVWLHYWLI